MDDNEALLEQFRRRLDEYNARLEQLKTRVGQVTARTAAEFDGQMTALRKELYETRERVALLARTGGQASKDLRTGFDKAWHELRNAFETATTRFN